MKHGAVLAVVAILVACTPKPQPPSSLNRDSATDADVTLSMTMVFDKPTVSACPDDMVEVEGLYCTNLETKCLHWLDPNNPGVNGPVQCAHFQSPTICKGKEVPKHFCIDRFEWPNKPGQLPTVYMSWEQTKQECEAIGKRLCTESEWTLACEGPERKPYPYGFDRDSNACNIDRTWIDPVSYRTVEGKKYTYPTPFERLDQRAPSGSKPQCVSDYGVYDMTGNVDEWVVNESGRPFKSGLKGGHWAIGARNRCRPMTEAHNETFTFYETSARCCADTR